jgi:hypothetical protein
MAVSLPRNGLMTTLRRLLQKFISVREDARRRRSYELALIRANDRDSFTYYQAGRVVLIEAELMAGEVDRRIDNTHPLAWDDGAELTPAEEEVVYGALCRHFDERSVRWRFTVPT